MNDRERFLATMRYEPRDRCPVWDFGFWDELLKEWHGEGLPDDVTNNEAAPRFFGMDDFDSGCGVALDLLPGFEPEVVKETEEYRWYRRSDGVVERWHKHSVTIPEPVEFLLTGRRSWPEYKKRLDPADPRRVPDDYAERVAKHRDAERMYPLCIGAGSLYGVLRGWIGVENLSLLLYDDRALVEEMVERRADCIVEPLSKALAIAREQGVTFDYAAMWEDICFNRGPLISPKMFREICGPHYRRITDLLRSYGCEFVMLDCDGRIDDLIPVWLDNGVNVMFPVEIGDWADPLELRRRFGKDLLMRGGFDKKILARGPQAITAEVGRLTPLVEEGGFIPHCDHRVPLGVRLADYIHYVNEAKRVWGKGLENLRPMRELKPA
ncbi:MAG TPA: uroporphyrinogen decarboxylase family protein [Phycisphaerae bacterium]|nr:uroporphyrinogen decarboxylase family protein [Phycisphaerae bacterium]